MTLEIRATHDGRKATEDRVLAVLDAQAEAAGFPFKPEYLAFEAWDGDVFLGGLTARLVQDWLYVTLLAVDEAARGRGVGRALMLAAETAARDRGATGIWLDTFSFQAPGFYERLGYARIATLPDSPAGEARFFYSRRL